MCIAAEFKVWMMRSSQKSSLISKVAKTNTAEQEAHAKTGLVHVDQPSIRAHQGKLRRQVKRGYNHLFPEVTTN